MSRRKAREVALQVLFEVDVGGNSLPAALAYALELVDTDEELQEPEHLGTRDRAFLEELVTGADAQRDKLDAIIARFATNWPLARMANVDRNILRLATFELYFRQDIPPNVTIDEAVELAKRFGTEDSPRFVNGVLAQMLRELKQTHGE